MNQGGDERSLACLIERSAELKRPWSTSRSARGWKGIWSDSSGREHSHEMLIEDEAVDVIDRFALKHRLPNGKIVLDQFLASWPDLSAANRDLLRGWREPVDGIFEIRGSYRDSLVLLNLVDDLEHPM